MISVNKVINFSKEVQDELKKVVWPDRPTAIRLTATVIIVSVFLAVYFGLLDFILTESIKSFIKK
ncbi:MAG: preprotein translocase subunit SecE [Patescibacteria group bacterium]